jgi:hypothetical protein
MALDLDPRWEGVVFDRAHWHFHSRLLQRYGIRLGPGEFSRMVRDIESGLAPLVDRRRDGTIYSVRIRSAKRRVFVLTKGRDVVTAYAPSPRLLTALHAVRLEPERLTVD